jgi:hypothetical protein
LTSGTPATDTQGHIHKQRRGVLWGARALVYVVYAYVVVTEIVLGLGFVLLLFGANPDPPFVQWVYRSLDRAMEPFRGIFTPIDLGKGGNDVQSVLDTSVLFAMLVYGLVAWGIHASIDWLSHRLERLDREDEEYQRQQAARQSLPRQASPGTAYPPEPAPGATYRPTRAQSPQSPQDG